MPSTPARLAADPVAQRAVDILVDDSRWTINLRMTIDPEVEDWLRFADETIPQLFNEHDEHRLTVDVSLAHPFVERFIGPDNENTELILRFAAAIAVALARLQRGGVSSATPLHYINQLLRESLAGNLT